MKLAIIKNSVEECRKGQEMRKQMQEENKQIDPGTMERLVQGNEQIGYYRSISNYEEALKISKEMLELVKELGLQESEAHGTTLLNAATAYRAAGMCEKAIAMYRAAEQIFKKSWNSR